MSEFEDIERYNQHLTESNLRLHRILASLPIAVMGTDTEGRIYEMNDAAQAQFGHAMHEVFEVQIADLVLGAEDRGAFIQHLREAIGEDKHIDFELPAVTREGNRLMVDWRVMPMRGMNGEISSVRLVANDITERVMQADRLKDLAFKDALTGLCNRRSFMDMLGTVGERSAGKPCSVILMDVDKFKNYNDTYGHPEGDTLLRRIGEILSAHLRDPYLPARFGGEEFIVLLPGADAKRGFRVAERLRLAIEEKTADLHGATVSLGVATTHNLKEESVHVIESADQALYKSKHDGRNRTTTWTIPAAA